MKGQVSLIDARNASFSRGSMEKDLMRATPSFKDEPHRSKRSGDRPDVNLSQYRDYNHDDAPCRGRRFVQPPKALMYDGTSDWAAFKQKYRRFVMEQDMSPESAVNYLCWVLTGRAAEFHALITRHSPPCSQQDILLKLEGRFGFKQLPETSYLEFQSAYQRTDERLEEWAERVRQLATYAFEVGHEIVMNSRDNATMIRKFCTGSLDKDAGLHAANKYPETLEEAISHILRYKLNRDATYGPPENREKRGSASVRAVQPSRGYSPRPIHNESQGRRDYSPGWYPDQIDHRGQERRRYQLPESGKRDYRRDYHEGSPPWARGQERRRYQSPESGMKDYRRDYREGSPPWARGQERRRYQSPEMDRPRYPEFSPGNDRIVGSIQDLAEKISVLSKQIGNIDFRLQKVEG
ncbi:hypothetical protein ElyMa_002089900 [Elysia marginata]|uniref:Retrotransposon gag domain-containing protein n=1 Tax=Elysia marginata TaxID=1093978 RepID=A0AAV4FCT4_9GAST|nr:hypothetical protein ElyMa_002089900 [Elysia marginata]